MSEKTETGKKELVCELIKADAPTTNGNIYTQHALDKLAYESNQASKRGTNFVVKDMPSDGRVLLTNVAARVHDTQVRDGQLVCQVELLNTPAGKEIQKMFSGDGVSIAPVAYGSTKDGHVVEEDLRFVGFSFVYNEPKK